MTRLLFLPATRFHVRYRIASGRPFSELDRLVLRAIVDGEAPTIDDLKETFQIPERPLLENLVTLFHASWIAMNSQGRFLPTDDGRRALRLRTTPLSMRVEDASQAILMETISGQSIALKGRVPLESAYDLENSNLLEIGHRLQPVMAGVTPDQGIVRSLLKPAHGNWIHSIEVPVPGGHNATFLRVVVDPESRRIIGLPDRWLPLLEETLLEEARRARPVSDPILLSIAPYPVDAKVEPKKITLRADDVVTTAADHASTLRAILETATAGSRILIAGERFSPTWLQQEWGEMITAALIRGVHVDLVWRLLDRVGAEESAEAQLDRALALINSGVGGDGERGRLRTNRTPARSRARFIVVIPPESLHPEAWISGWEWLSPPSSAALGTSIRIRDTDILAELAHTATALFETATEGTLSALPDAWRDVAGSLDERRSLGLVADKDAQRNCTARLLRDREIDRTVLDRTTRARERLWLRTRNETTGFWLLKRLADGQGLPSSRSVAFVSTFPKPPTFDAAAISWAVESHTAGETLLVDNSVIVAGCMSGGQAPNEPSFKDVGILIEDGPVVNSVAELWSDTVQGTPSP